jgi:hypothetical protein
LPHVSRKKQNEMTNVDSLSDFSNSNFVVYLTNKNKISLFFKLYSKNSTFMRCFSVKRGFSNKRDSSNEDSSFKEKDSALKESSLKKDSALEESSTKKNKASKKYLTEVDYMKDRFHTD